MSTEPVIHDTFTIERTYDASAKEVFAAWADPDMKARWFVGPEGWTQVERALDFRVGGSELLHGTFEGGRTTIFTARYHDIVPDQRIVYVYDMHLDGALFSVSLATARIRPVGNRTRLVYTEQGVFLDGSTESAKGRVHGTAAHLDRLGPVLQEATPAPRRR